ncbi:MAG: winged helix-turn-helix transcriptional regulator [Flavobacteriales bacterium]|nr:winged helix-turn-helix transcriptional regulator [Flavobacteriales bacterium]
MGLSKTSAFTKRDKHVARYAKALAHPARVSILRLLAGKRSCVCGDIVDELPLAQSTVSQHLKELKAAGLIQGTITGTSVCYCIDPKEWALAQQTVMELMQSFREVDASCCSTAADQCS